MSKILVIFSSKYGHTKLYALWLSEALNADICDAKELKKVALQDYSTVIFGSSLYASGSKAAALIVKHFERIKNKNVILFTCGLADVESASNIEAINNNLNKVLTPEIRNSIKIFHVRGGIDYNKLSFMHKLMMKFVYSQTSKKPQNELTDEDKDFISTYGQKIDFSDKKMLEPIIHYVNSK